MVIIEAHSGLREIGRTCRFADDGGSDKLRQSIQHFAGSIVIKKVLIMRGRALAPR
jgi:hypothetical protein